MFLINFFGLLKGSLSSGRPLAPAKSKTALRTIGSISNGPRKNTKTDIADRGNTNL